MQVYIPEIHPVFKSAERAQRNLNKLQPVIEYKAEIEAFLRLILRFYIGLGFLFAFSGFYLRRIQPELIKSHTCRNRELAFAADNVNAERNEHDHSKNY